MKNSKLLIGLACISLLVSACSDSGGSGPAPAPKKGPVTTTSDNQPVKDNIHMVGNISVEITEEQSKHVLFYSIEEARRLELPVNPPVDAKAIIVVQPNSLVKYLEGSKTTESELATRPETKFPLYWYSTSSSIQVTLASTLRKSLESSNSSNNTSDTEANIGSDLDFTDAVLVDIPQDQIEQIEIPNTRNSEDLTLEESTEEVEEQVVEEVNPVDLWKNLSFLSKKDQVKLNCNDFLEIYTRSTLETIAPAELSSNSSALVALRCVARKSPINLLKHITDNFSKSSRDLIINAIDAPVLSILLAKYDNKSGLELLELTNEFSYHNKVKDISFALDFMDAYSSSLDLDKSTNRNVLRTLTKKLLNYSDENDKKISSYPLGKILALIDDNKSDTKYYFQKVLSAKSPRQVKKEDMEFLKKILLVKAKVLSIENCKVYELTSRQNAALYKIMGQKKYNTFLDMLADSNTSRKGSDFYDVCSINQ